jgi:hypothetical protein
LLAATAAFLGVLASAGSARACSCAEIAARDALRQADAALVGELVDLVPRQHGLADYRYEVQRVYKSARRIGAVISVRSATQSAACGLPSQAGKRYGLFLSWGEGRWRGGLCGVIEPRHLRAVANRMPSKRRGSEHGVASCAS